MNTIFVLLLLASFVAVAVLAVMLVFSIIKNKKNKMLARNTGIATAVLFISLIGSIATTETEEKEIADEPEKVEAKASKVDTTKKDEEEEKPLTLEEQSQKFIDENLDGKTIKDFTSAFLTLDDDELKKMIVVGHADGRQFTDDFDLLGRKAMATGKIMSFTELSRNTYNDRGKKNDSVTFTREDRFVIYMGDKNIDDFEKIHYDSLYQKDQDINNFFLGVYPEEVTNFVTVDLDEEATLTIGDTITVEGFISNYVVREDYTNPNIIKEFFAVIDNAHVLNDDN